MRLIVQASNIHQGGGKTLLLPLLAAIDQPCIAFLDSRLENVPALSSQVEVIRVRPTLVGRLGAELSLRAHAKVGDVVLCFGNLPPLFPSKAKIKVFLQNRYLTTSTPTDGLSYKARVRICIERLWLRYCLRNAKIVVQTQTMARDVEQALGCSAECLPFFPTMEPGSPSTGGKEFDYIYVASGEPHKNHRTLIEAWQILQRIGSKPSLCLTLNARREPALTKWVANCAAKHGLSVQLVDAEGPTNIANLLARSGAVIFPSRFESFGLPLLEAKNAGLPVLASERDYVRDILEPTQTFDPESALSIARAVLRHQGTPMPRSEVHDPANFIRAIQIGL